MINSARSRPYPDQMVDLHLNTTTTHDKLSQIRAVSRSDDGPAPKHDHNAALNVSRDRVYKTIHSENLGKQKELDDYLNATNTQFEF